MNRIHAHANREEHLRKQLLGERQSDVVATLFGRSIMRTAIFITVGLALVGLCILLNRALHLSDRIVLWAFLGLWLMAVAVNFVLGVAKAGYTVRQELPIAALCFGLPACVAALFLLRAL